MADSDDPTKSPAEPSGTASSSLPPAPAPSGTPELGLEGLPRVGVGIRIKLIGLMVAMSVVIVAPLATYLP